MKRFVLAALLAALPLCARAQIIPGTGTGNGSMTFQTGRVYTPNGVITVAAETDFSTTSLMAGTPIYVPNSITLQTLSCETGGTVTGTAHARMVLYADAGGVPGTPVAGTDTGDLTQTTSGVLTSGTLGAALSPGWYWPVLETSGLAGGTLFGAATAKPSINTQLGSNNATSALGAAATFRTILMTHTYGTTLPTWSTSSEGVASHMPLIALGF